MATSTRHDSMVNPAIEQLLDAAGNKFLLVTLGATRARQINSYFNKLGDGQGGIPPQVASVARKPLSIAFEEIADGLIVPTFEDPEEAAEGGDEAVDVTDDGGDGELG